MADDFSINTKQAVAVLAERLGRRIWAKDVDHVATMLVSIGHLRSECWGEGGWTFEPDDLDVVAGELVRMRLPWRRKALWDRGFRAVVDRGDGVREVVLLPWKTDKGAWGAIADGERPESVDVVEWPTGRKTGVLVANGAVSGGLPVYVMLSDAGRNVSVREDEAGFGVLEYRPD